MMTPNQLRTITILMEKIQAQAVELRLITDSTPTAELNVALGYLDEDYAQAVKTAMQIAPYKATR